MRTIAFWCAILMAFVSNQAKATIAVDGSDVYFQFGYGDPVYILPLQVGINPVNQTYTGFAPLDLSGSGDGRLCALYNRQLRCNVGGFPLGLTYDTVDSGGGMLALADYATNKTDVRLLGGRFISLQYLENIDMTSEFGCGVDTGSVANCWNNFGNPVTPPGLVRNGVLELSVGAGISTWWLTTTHGNGLVTIWDRLTNATVPNNFANAWSVTMDGDDVCVADRDLITADFSVYCNHLVQPGAQWTLEFGPTPDLPEVKLYNGFLIVNAGGVVTMSMY